MSFTNARTRPKIAVVVDTSVARAAGQGRLGKKSRDALKVLEERQVFVVAMSEALYQEWRKPRHHDGNVYASRYALQWLARMTSRRQVVRFKASPLSVIRQTLAQMAGQLSSLSPRASALLKDLHVIEAAVGVERLKRGGDAYEGKRVISHDEKVRQHAQALEVAGVGLDEACEVQWVIVDDVALRWLQNGAPVVADYQLCRALT